MILNRLGLNDLIEPINRNLEFQLQDPFLLYRNEKGNICELDYLAGDYISTYFIILKPVCFDILDDEQ